MIKNSMRAVEGGNQQTDSHLNNGWKRGEGRIRIPAIHTYCQE